MVGSTVARIVEVQKMAEYKRNINWFLFELLKKQYTISDEEELKTLYQFEITEFEEMVLWAYEIDLAIGRIENVSKKEVDDLRFDSKTKWMFKCVESWRPCFKYIKDYQAHLNDVIYNCSIYHGIDKPGLPFEYENSWLVNFRDNMYRRLTGSNEVSQARKKNHASLITVG